MFNTKGVYDIGVIKVAAGHPPPPGSFDPGERQPPTHPPSCGGASLDRQAYSPQFFHILSKQSALHNREGRSAFVNSYTKCRSKHEKCARNMINFFLFLLQYVEFYVKIIKTNV